MKKLASAVGIVAILFAAACGGDEAEMEEMEGMEPAPEMMEEEGMPADTTMMEGGMMEEGMPEQETGEGMMDDEMGG